MLLAIIYFKKYLLKSFYLTFYVLFAVFLCKNGVPRSDLIFYVGLWSFWIESNLLENYILTETHALYRQNTVKNEEKRLHKQ